MFKLSMAPFFTLLGFFPSATGRALARSQGSPSPSLYHPSPLHTHATLSTVSLVSGVCISYSYCFMQFRELAIERPECWYAHIVAISFGSWLAIDPHPALYYLPLLFLFIISSHFLRAFCKVFCTCFRGMRFYLHPFSPCPNEPALAGTHLFHTRMKWVLALIFILSR
ncbi:MAG: hypothetical protein J3Q66DRAFT_165948 [Benniella sp.]|nr:MAG: hypothetical protein J3Q66DRAFT_165948 [Benniella sp.]